MSKNGREESETRDKRTKTHTTHKSISINKCSVNRHGESCLPSPKLVRAGIMRDTAMAAERYLASQHCAEEAGDYDAALKASMLRGQALCNPSTWAECAITFADCIRCDSQILLKVL